MRRRRSTHIGAGGGECGEEKQDDFEKGDNAQKKRETVKNKEYLPKLMWCRCCATLPA